MYTKDMAPFRLATRFFSDSVGAMLSPSVVSEVRRLLALGELSQRKIARLTGVSRSVVRRIATGKRKGRTAKPKEAWEIAGTGKIGKCPTCVRGESQIALCGLSYSRDRTADF